MRVARLIFALAFAGLWGAATADAAIPATSPYIVAYTESSPAASGRTDQLEREIGFVTVRRYDSALKGFAASLSAGQVLKLRAKEHVAAVAPDVPTRIRPRAATTPDVTPVGVVRIGASDSTSSWGAADSAVAVLDTGLDLTNPDLNAGSGVNCVNKRRSPQDDNGHGTHVGGTIAARAGGGGAVGVAPGTELIPVKVLGANGSGWMSELLCGIDWVHANAAGRNIKVANVSITATGFNDGNCGASNADPLHMAICNSKDAGILYVAAAGNSGRDFATTVPAAYPEILTVTAATDTDGTAGGKGPLPCDSKERDDTYATFSNFGTSSVAAAHTLAAPGTCVVSTKVGGGVDTMIGTSMAAPHVAATAALCLSSGRACASLDRSERVEGVIEQLRSDAADDAERGLGFVGDPLQPVSGRQMGFLVSARDY